MTCSPFSRVSGMLGSLVSALLLAGGQAGAQAPLPDYQLQPAGPHQVTAGFGKSTELGLTLGNGSSTQSADWKLVFEGNAATGLPGVLESLDSHSADLLSVIPDRYLFGEGITGSEIGDGGGDMYDGGNMLSSGGSPLVYSNGVATFAVVVLPEIPHWKIDQFERSADGSMVLGFPADPGATYEVQYSDDLATWKQVPTRILATGDRVSWTDRGAPDTDRHPSEESSRYYRIEKIESAGN